MRLTHPSISAIRINQVSYKGITSTVDHTIRQLCGWHKKKHSEKIVTVKSFFDDSHLNNQIFLDPGF